MRSAAASRGWTVRRPSACPAATRTGRSVEDAAGRGDHRGQRIHPDRRARLARPSLDLAATASGIRSGLCNGADRGAAGRSSIPTSRPTGLIASYGAADDRARGSAAGSRNFLVGGNLSVTPWVGAGGAQGRVFGMRWKIDHRRVRGPDRAGVWAGHAGAAAAAGAACAAGPGHRASSVDRAAALRGVPFADQGRVAGARSPRVARACRFGDGTGELRSCASPTGARSWRCSPIPN